MASDEEIIKTEIEDFVPKNALLPTEEMLQKYGEMSVEEQREEFLKIVSFLNTKPKNKKPVFFLMFLRLTKPTIIFKHEPKSDNDMYKQIMEVADLFKSCLEELNKIPNEKLSFFVDRMSKSEAFAAHTFTNEMISAFQVYPMQYDSESSMAIAYMTYTRHFSDVLQEHKDWISEMVEDFKSGTKKSKRRVLEEGKNAFKESEKKYKCGGWVFLALTSVVAGILLLWGLQLGFNILNFSVISSNDYYFVVSSIVGKIIVSATLFFLLGAFSKTYFAHKHNETISRQRHDILYSYEDIYNVTDEKKFVLQKVAEAVFAHQPTGFSKLQSDKGDSSVSLSDIVNIVSKNGDKG